MSSGIGAMWADPKRRKYVLYGGAVGLAVLFVVYRRLKGSSSTAATWSCWKPFGPCRCNVAP